MDINQEELLEQKYHGLLVYTDAKQFLEKTPYTGPKITGAIKRFCNAEDATKPDTFVEMESFVNDLADFWIDSNPEIHSKGERILRSALSNYVAYSIVWKAKSKSSNIISQDLVKNVGLLLARKNALVSAFKIINSRLAHDNCPNKEIYADLKKCLAEAFFVMLPLVHGIETGKLTLPEGQTENDLHRIIGGFFAGNPAVLGANLSMKQIEHKTDKPEE